MKRTLFLGILSLIQFISSAQTFTISGYITDASSGEKLISATVYDANTVKGAISNTYGFYSLSLPKGKIKFTVSYVGYQTYTEEIDLTENIKRNIALEQSIELGEVEVVGNKIERHVESTEMSVIELQMKTISTLPVLLGEVDVMKTIQLLPGVQSGNEGTSGIYVRGGGPDQNLILLDGVPVYNANHLFGFFSVFNADAISNIKLIKGGFPARYGGRLSSVIDIKMKEGSTKQFKGEASIGLIASKLTFEGPIIKDKTSFIVSARRTYIDLLLQPFIAAAALSQGVTVRGGYFFQDFNAKVNHKFSDRNHLYLSAYSGKDKLYANSTEIYDGSTSKYNFGIQWGNITSTLRWNYLISDKLFSNTTLTYSNYTFETPLEYSYKEKILDTYQTESFKMSFLSGIRDYAANLDFDYIPSPNQYIRFGLSNTYHIFKPGINTIKMSSRVQDANVDTTFGNNDLYANEYGAYFEDEFSLFSNILKINAGLRFNGFFVQNKNYQSFEPRISARARISDNVSIKAAYSKMSQNLHLLTSSTIGLPTDLWLPSTDSIPPQYSEQYALGVFFNIYDQYSFSVEGFYKTMLNLVEYKDGADYFSQNTNWQNKLEIGQGEAYGLELLVEKKLGKITGWIGYTLSWSNRQFDNINFGKQFPYKYDRRHDISVVFTYQLKENIDLGFTWVYGTGNATTLSVEKYMAGGQSYYDPYYGKGEFYPQIADYYESRNSYRMPAYHRLDLSANFHRKTNFGTRTFSLGVYNAYNRKNPMFLNLEYSYAAKKYDLVQYSFFPLIPSISYKISF
jgi:outer membrane receptor for ferrienterochelin and colicin